MEEALQLQAEVPLVDSLACDHVLTLSSRGSICQ